jgi:hypothetical protein
MNGTVERHAATAAWAEAAAADTAGFRDRIGGTLATIEAQ